MRLKYNSSFKRDRIEFIAEPGLEIEVPDELGERLARAYSRFEIVKQVEKKPAPQAKAEAEPAPVPKKKSSK